MGAVKRVGRCKQGGKRGGCKQGLGVNREGVSGVYKTKIIKIEK